MRKYVIKKLITGAVTVLVVFVLNYLLLMLAPGEPISYLMGADSRNAELRQALEEKYGLDQPLSVQFGQYMGTILKGDFGSSIIYGEPVLKMIQDKIPATVLLGLTSAVLSVLLGTAAGIYAARKEGGLFDRICSLTAYIANALPPFFIGILLIMLFSTYLGWLPSYGMADARADYSGAAQVFDILTHMVLPVVTLIFTAAPGYFRTARNAVRQASAEDYVTLLRATGMRSKWIYRRYILKNAILPSVTLFGMSLAYLITGVTLVETVFAWPGMGRLIMTAISQRDYPVLMGVFLMVSVILILMMLAVDLINAVLDPRIRY